MFPWITVITFSSLGQAMEKLGHAARHRGQHILAKSSRHRGRAWEAGLKGEDRWMGWVEKAILEPIFAPI